MSDSDGHEFQTSRNVWDGQPENVIPIRSLNDSAFVVNDCLAVARQHGATPLHKIKKTVKYFEKPEAYYQWLVNFGHH
jgi:hypothetical protein